MVNFGCRDFLGFCWNPKGFFGGFDFCTHSIIPDHHIPAFSQAILPLKALKEEAPWSSCLILSLSVNSAI